MWDRVGRGNGGARNGEMGGPFFDIGKKAKKPLWGMNYGCIGLPKIQGDVALLGGDTRAQRKNPSFFLA